MSSTFQITIENMFEQTKDIFMSEDFVKAINIIHECFPEGTMPKSVILDYFLGKKGLVINGDDVSFSDDQDTIDFDYKQEIDEILFNYRNLIKHNDEYLKIIKAIPFSLNNYADTNEFIKELKNNKNIIINSHSISYADEISQLHLDLGSHIYITDDFIYVLDNSKTALISGITEPKSNIEELIFYFDNFMNEE